MIGIARRAASLCGRVLQPRRTAHAHSGTHSYVYVVIDNNGVQGNAQFPIGDLNKAVGLEIPNDEPGALAAVATSLDEIRRYTLAHLSLEDDQGEWKIQFTGHRVLARKAGSYAILDYEVAPGLDRVPHRFTITYDGIIDADHHHEAIVIVRSWAGFGKLRTATDQHIPCAAGATSHEVVIPERSSANDIKGAVACVTSSAKEWWRRAKKRIRR